MLQIGRITQPSKQMTFNYTIILLVLYCGAYRITSGKGVHNDSGTERPHGHKFIRYFPNGAQVENSKVESIDQ